ncbi:camp-dependent protein kinase regulatory subunit [Irpex rosettiformis]|uniref:Camp-dependent protein kinase regulatory subunit n=1 Tax=Irpex rosettiformis TaxID=378272 RepID=A0ACB8UCJ9_9APHY|nr:camp-dependent protein kinase regulatory subunit [Irpex rosettiformis]
MSTFDALVADLTRDAYRVQPKDALQFCANWFQARLEEQRTRTRDALSNRMTPVRDLPTDHYLDTPLSPTASATAGSPFSQVYNQPRSSLHGSSPFGTLNVPGNALLGDRNTSNLNTFHPPTFKLDGEDLSPSSPLSPPDPFTSFANGIISPNGPEEFLQPPSSMILARRTSVSAESIPVDTEFDEPLRVYPKSAEQTSRIRTSIMKNFIFQGLDEEQQQGVLNAMQEINVEKDEVVIRQGDVGEYFYVVESGYLECYIRDEPLPPDWLQRPRIAPTSDKFVQPGHHPEFGKRVDQCREGSAFGQLALMYGHPRAASVVSIEPSILWSLDRITFRTIILKAAHRKRTMYEGFLSSVPLLTSLEPEERSKIADALISQVYDDGNPVVRQGEMGDTFFFVEDGEAIVTKKLAQGEEIQVARLKKGDYFGELSLLRREPRAATVSAAVRTNSSAPKLKVAALDASAFTRLLGPLREIMDRHAGLAYGPRR